MNTDDDRLRDAMSRQTKRLRGDQRSGVLGLLVTGSTVGLLMVVPLVLGAYLGHWLDERSAGYSVRWTLNLILLGLIVGVANVILFFRSHWR